MKTLRPTKIPLSRGLRLATVLVIATLTGCGTLSGVGGTASLSCPLPNGALCKPISEVYKMQKGASSDVNAVASSANSGAAGSSAPSNLPTAPGLTRYEPSPGTFSAEARVAPSSGPPIRSAAKMLRIWLAPYEDDEGALRDHGYMYVMVDPGKWQVEHNQQRIMKQYAPIIAPKSLGKSGADGSTVAAKPNPSSASAFPFLPANQQPAAAGAGGIYSDQQSSGESANPLAPVAPTQQ
jgi:conjugal transfer pilus assembly protein TraV